MYVLGISKLGQRAQEIISDDPRLADTLAVESGDALHFYQLCKRESSPAWQSYYTEWAKTEPVDNGQFRLSHMSISGKWQDLDIVKSFDGCIGAILANTYNLFFL